MTNSTPACSYVQQGDISKGLISILGCYSDPWIIDSGASDHMTGSARFFSNYTPCAGNKRVSTADGNECPIAGQGLIPLTSSLSLNSALHVPKLTCNLISITKLTKDLNCSLTFFPSHCVIQDQATGKMIGHAKEQGGLYFLEAMGGNGTISSMACSLKESDILIWHKRLGHPSFSTMQKMFPSFEFSKISFHCEICEMEKHHRTTFHPINERSSIPFSLIHTNVWEKSSIPNISSA